MNIFDRLMRLDRRWVFLFLVVVCVFGYYLDYAIPVRVTKEVQSIYDYIDTRKPGEIVFVAIDYDPSNQAELHPMAYALMEHAFRRDLKVIFTALSQNGPGMADQAIRDIADSLRIERTYNGETFPAKEIQSGVDYTFLGYKPYYAIIILSMGQNFRIPFPTDYYGTPLDSLPMMKGVFNYDQIACLIDLSGGNITDAWISYGQGRYNFKLALGLTGVMTAQYYPYLNSGQVFGIMGGMLGAAQYEKLSDNPGLAIDGMRVQLPAHIIIVLFIIIGNVGYFMSRRANREGR